MKPAHLLCLLSTLFAGAALACSYAVPGMQNYAREKKLVVYGQFDSRQGGVFLVERSLNGTLPAGRYRLAQESDPSCPSVDPLPPPSSAKPVEEDEPSTAPTRANAGDHYYLFVSTKGDNALQQLWGTGTSLRVHRQQVIALTPPTTDDHRLTYYHEGERVLQNGYWTIGQKAFEKWLKDSSGQPVWRFIEKPIATID